ncbi:helix-turn-helix domain-containing protein [Shinella yambaruensis]
MSKGLSVRDVAATLRVSKSTIYNALQAQETRR